jgi:hypothetical protein
MDRTGLEISVESPTKGPLLKTGGAESGALLLDLVAKYQDLTALPAAWPTLSDDVRRRIMDLVRGK